MSVSRDLFSEFSVFFLRLFNFRRELFQYIHTSWHSESKVSIFLHFIPGDVLPAVM